MSDINLMAGLITCHNRKQITLNCLKSLFKITSDIDVYLVDDGSVDGTAEAVKYYYPNVNIIEGNGNLYWSRGMQLAWSFASCKDYEFYLWLNDDVRLYPWAINEVLECSKLKDHQSIISGIIEDRESNRIIYGGFSEKGEILQPNNDMQSIFYMHGNFVLVPRFVYRTIGGIDKIFHHDLGDVDYGLTALKRKINVFTTRRTIASGEANEFCRVRKWGTNVFRRFKVLFSPMGSHPHIIFYFRRKHFGLFHAVLYSVHLVFINILSDKLVGLIFGDRYK